MKYIILSKIYLFLVLAPWAELVAFLAGLAVPALGLTWVELAWAALGLLRQCPIFCLLPLPCFGPRRVLIAASSKLVKLHKLAYAIMW